MPGADRKAPQVGAPSHRLRTFALASGADPVGCLGFTHGLSGAWQERNGITSLGRDAQGLTFSVVIPARAIQPGVSTRGKQKWCIALCGYGMTLAPRHRVHCCVWHRWRTSPMRTGSDDLWPDFFEEEVRVGSRASPQVQVTPFCPWWRALGVPLSVPRTLPRSMQAPLGRRQALEGCR